MDYLTKNTELYGTLLQSFILVSNFGTVYERSVFMLAASRFCFVGKNEEEKSSAPQQKDKRDPLRKISLKKKAVSMIGKQEFEEEEDYVAVSADDLFYATQLQDKDERQEEIFTEKNQSKPSFLVCNLQAFALLLTVFKQTNSVEVKETLLQLFETLFVHFCEYESIKILEPFQILLSQFEIIPFTLRQRVMILLDIALSASKNNLYSDIISEEECRTFLSLLSARRPSTVLLVAGELVKLLKNKKLKSLNLFVSGLMDLIERVLVPVKELPQKEGLFDKTEIRDCVKIILHSTSNTKMLEKVSVLNELSFIQFKFL